MPIRTENKNRYPKDWPEISRAKRKAAGNRCEWCNVPNRTLVYRFETGEYMLEDGAVHDETGELLGYCRGSEAPKGRFIEIVLTVAHLDHQPENCADDNLAALCQRCHNRYDMPMRQEGRRKRARSKLACADFFDVDSQS